MFSLNDYTDKMTRRSSTTYENQALGTMSNCRRRLFLGGVYMHDSGLSFNPDRTHSVSVEIVGD